MVCAAAHAGEETPLPFLSKQLHVGVATCAGSNCHGSSQPFDDSTVQQNEYFSWQRKDAHSNAYKLLLSPAGRRIADNLGIKSAEKAPECLTCHTDYVAQAARGRRYQVSEGVSCEACHGGSQDWLGPHVSGNTHAQNLAQGLYPLEDPVRRAEVCLHCHAGSTEKPIDHRMMGAGHPPLEFELDTFTAIEPAHFRVDKDYRSRKAYANDAQVWAAGQLVAARFFLDGLTSARFTGRGMFPELAFFDCNACHHATRPPRWNAGLATPLGPGEVRLADANLVMAAQILDLISPSGAKQWREALADLHRASGQSVSKVKEAAKKLRQILGDTADRARDHQYTRQEAIVLMRQIATSGIERDAGGYSAAKQTYYALDALRVFLSQEQEVKSTALDKAVDQVFAAVDANNNYDPEAMRNGLRSVKTALAGLP